MLFPMPVPPPDFQVAPSPNVERATLVGFAYLPARTFSPGVPAGKFLSAGPSVNNQTLPFPGQAVQGISGGVRDPDGLFTFLVDNGFGLKKNSADALLRLYRAQVDFKTPLAGTGEVSIKETIQLRDPKRFIPQKIIADLTHFPLDTTIGFAQPSSEHRVPAEIREQRLLTGADFDPESVCRAADGSLWIGDELGPFLLHFSADGELLEAPISIPVPTTLRDFSRGHPSFISPDHPTLADSDSDHERISGANVRRSKGIEGMAISEDGRRLLLMLEGPMVMDPNQKRLIITEFDLNIKAFSDRYWFYDLELPYNADAAPNERTKIGDFVNLAGDTFLVHETDDGQRSDARLKKIYKVDLSSPSGSTVSKVEVADLMTVSNPHLLSSPLDQGWFGGGEQFCMPHFCMETIIIMDPQTVLVVNDNNFPTTGGNARKQDESDGTEFCLIRLPKS